MNPTRAVLCAFLFVGTARLAAQCPDGTPPPCRIAVRTAVRSADPPTDPKTWIVVPFDNIAHSADVEWMRAASVNLLYLDLSRWQDIHVIDDERVADFIRDVPSARGSAPLSLSAGLMIARRAGAGRLVMGDLLKTGNHLAVVAKVFDVRTSQRIRSPREETSTPDSIMPVFSRLARGILAVEPPTGATLGEVGTTSIAAYQEYLAGVKLLSAFELEAAAERFSKALAIDSTFALAHFKLANALLWRASNDPRGPQHAEAALRLSGKLPARERALIRGFSYFPKGDFAAMCAAYAPLVKADSTDLDALGGMADCLFHDAVVVPDPQDSTRGQFRSSYNEALRLFRLALKVDPTYLLAYQHLVDAYTRDTRVSRTTPRGTVAGTAAYVAVVNRAGDTVSLEPRLVSAGTPASDSLLAAPAHRQARLVHLAIIDTLVREWVSAAPTEARARLAAGTVALLRADPFGAREHFNRVTGSIGPRDSSTIQFERFEANFRSYDVTGIARWVDSALSAVAPAGRRGNVAQVATLAGRPAVYDSVIRAAFASSTPEAARYWLLARRLFVGEPVDGVELEAAEKDYQRFVTARDPATGGQALRMTLSFGARLPRSTWPALDSVPANINLRPAAAIAHNDTVRLRAAARGLDSISRSAVRWLVSDTGAYLIAADAYLALHDSAAALRSLQRGLDSIVVMTPMMDVTPAGTLAPALIIPRAMLLRADVAAALGHREEANLWYRRLDALWAKAEPEMEPLRARVRKGIAATSVP